MQHSCNGAETSPGARTIRFLGHPDSPAPKPQDPVLDEQPTTAELLETWRDATRAAELADRLAQLAARAVQQADLRAAEADEIAAIAEQAAEAAATAAKRAREAADRARKVAMTDREDLLSAAEADQADARLTETAARDAFHEAESEAGHRQSN